MSPIGEERTSFLAPRTQAGLLIVLLGAGILVAISPYVIGLLGVGVLHVLGAPMHARLTRVLRPRWAAAAVVAVMLATIVLPAALTLGLVLDQAPGAIESFRRNAIFERLRDVTIGPVNLGAELSNAGERLVQWMSAQAFDLFGVAARTAVNIVIALTGLFFTLTAGPDVWRSVKQYIPFSDAAAELLRARFYNVTQATFYGTVVVALVQGALVTIGFLLVGLPSALFWGVVAGLASILPLFGGALVWAPAGLVLLAQQKTIPGIILLAWGGVVVSNVDNVIRPIIYRRLSNVHPLTTLIGAFAGLQYFGLLGVLVGPLAITYFFELLRIFDEEYGVVESMRRATVALRASGLPKVTGEFPGAGEPAGPDAAGEGRRSATGAAGGPPVPPASRDRVGG
jgi:predicted PurR-regulated permease PerM